MSDLQMKGQMGVVDMVPGATLTVSEGPMQDPVYGSAWVGAYAADGFAIVQEAEK